MYYKKYPMILGRFSRPLRKEIIQKRKEIRIIFSIKGISLYDLIHNKFYFVKNYIFLR